MCSSRWNSSSPALKTSSPGIGMPVTRPTIGLVSWAIRRWIGYTFSSHQLAGLGQTEKTERLAGRRCVDDDDVELATVVVLGDPEQAGELVHPGQDAHLLGHHVVEAAPPQNARYVRLDRAPVLIDVVEDLGLLAPQVRAESGRLGSERTVEGVGEAVRRVRRQDDRPMAAIGREQTGRGGHAGLADAALAGVDDDPSHGLSFPLC